MNIKTIQTKRNKNKIKWAMSTYMLREMNFRPKNMGTIHGIGVVSHNYELEYLFGHLL